MFRILLVASVLCFGCDVDSTSEGRRAAQRIATDVAEGSSPHALNAEALAVKSQHTPTVPLRSINANRGIVKIPKLKNEPKYCLLMFGRLNKRPVWLVADGTTIFVDRNSNGDLTEPGERITVSDRSEAIDYRDGHYDPVEIILDDAGNESVEFEIGWYQTKDNPVHHFMKVRKDGEQRQYAGWCEIFSDSQETAKIFDFGGKYSPVPLRSKHLYPDGEQELSVAFTSVGQDKNSKTLLAYDVVPPEVTPVAEIKWPASESEEPVRTTVHLKSRC
ncbi:hypothetical protein N9L06_06745 [Mariniblastus sp.]|nr:hypothetical protein [Mariniblastus sp.]